MADDEYRHPAEAVSDAPDYDLDEIEGDIARAFGGSTSVSETTGHMTPEEEPDSEAVFEAELFLSTDGKNTVHVKATDRIGREEALKWAKRVYDGMLKTYGNKSESVKKATGMTCETCGAGMELKSGSKNGKAWKGYFCTSGEKHPVKWVD